MKPKRSILLSTIVVLSAACGTSQPAPENQNSAVSNFSRAVNNPASEKAIPVAAAPSSLPQISGVEPKNSTALPAKEDSAKTQDGLSITTGNFDKIKTGMSYAEIVQILGSPGENAGEFKTSNGSMAMYRWKGRSEKGDWVLSTQFVNGKLSDKSQFGLK